jgi:hypothetical protein
MGSVHIHSADSYGRNGTEGNPEACVANWPYRYNRVRKIIELYFVEQMTSKTEMLLRSGEVAITCSGRRTTPFPEIRLGTNRKANLTLRRVDSWLHENALNEAEARGDKFAAAQFRQENPKKLPPACKFSMAEYLQLSSL